MAEYNGRTVPKAWPTRKKASTYAMDLISLCTAVPGGLGPMPSDSTRRTFPRAPRLLLRAGFRSFMLYFRVGLRCQRV